MTVLGRNCVFGSHTTFVSLNFQKEWAHMRCTDVLISSSVSVKCLRALPTNGSLTIQCFEHGSMSETHDRITYHFFFASQI